MQEINEEAIETLTEVSQNIGLHGIEEAETLIEEGYSVEETVKLFNRRHENRNLYLGDAYEDFHNTLDNDNEKVNPFLIYLILIEEMNCTPFEALQHLKEDPEFVMSLISHKRYQDSHREVIKWEQEIKTDNVKKAEAESRKRNGPDGPLAKLVMKRRKKKKKEKAKRQMEERNRKLEEEGRA